MKICQHWPLLIIDPNLVQDSKEISPNSETTGFTSHSISTFQSPETKKSQASLLLTTVEANQLSHALKAKIKNIPYPRWKMLLSYASKGSKKPWSSIST
jgi:hypothetical protein